MITSERVVVKKFKSEHFNDLSNISFSSDNSFYENLNLETKKDIIFLIKSGYDKKIIIKLYIFLKPSNLNEAIHFLTKEKGIFQHIFINSNNKNNSCEICGEQKIYHINKIDKSLTISYNTYNSIISNKIDDKSEILRIKTINEKNYENKKCKICDEKISNEEEIRNKCEQCGNHFCSECLYLYIKELIKTGNYDLFCPECKFVYTRNKIEQIFSFNKENKEEIINLKKLLIRSNTKQMILSNSELIFCPIADCDGYARKNNNQKYNICNMGHKFCEKCGELWHEDGKCKEEENVDKLFQEYHRRYNLKNCPYCHIVTNKIDGCNHIRCQYCGKHWCWLCQELFTSTEEHYGNINSKCYKKMMQNNNNEVIICSKCNNEVNGHFGNFNCSHRICNNCFTEHLLSNCAMIIYPQKIINCIILGCNGIRIIGGSQFIEYINGTNNQKLIKKYKISFLFLLYFLMPFFPPVYGDYTEIYGCIIELAIHIFKCVEKYNLLYSILEIIGIIFGIIFFPVFIIVLPIFPHYAIKKLYYCKFLPDIKGQINNKIILVSIFISEEILFLIFLFDFIILHFIYTILVLPIFGLVILNRNKIYRI